MSDHQPSELPTRRTRSGPAISNEAVLAPRSSNDAVTALWTIAGVLVLAATVLYWFTFSVGTEASAETLLASARTLELANVALICCAIALTGGLVVTGLRWRPRR